MLNKFSSGNLDILVCSDALARGIDIGTTDLVISYDCPQFVKTYIHRVGRTARAGQVGTAITILEGVKEEKKLKAMMKEAGKKIGEALNVDEDNLDEASYAEAREKAAKIIRDEKADAQGKKVKARTGAKRMQVQGRIGAKRKSKKKN